MFNLCDHPSVHPSKQKPRECFPVFDLGENIARHHSNHFKHFPRFSPKAMEKNEIRILGDVFRKISKNSYRLLLIKRLDYYDY